MRPQLLPLLLLIFASASTIGSTGSGGGYYGDRNLQMVNNMCYHQHTGQAKFCQPQFENLAVNQAVQASSTCGSPPVQVCRQDEAGRHCDVCDASAPKRSHPASHLTDYHVHGSCWISSQLSGSQQSVNLTLSLRKKHTVYYMSITGCGTDLPDAMEAYKSSDYGSTWQLWHLFSKNCTRDYKRRGYSYQFRETIQPKEVICSDINLITKGVESGGFSLQQPVLSFSTNFNRASSAGGSGGGSGGVSGGGGGGGSERDPVIIDWMLATDLRLILRRHPQPNGSFPSQPFAFSNLDVGGRCFCNGHASRCILRGEHPVCECAHGTEGDDCERCKPLWVDLPWRRGTLSKPTECRLCNCNGHSEECSFDQDLYTKTGSVRGGRCARCQHNTQGPNCEECAAGYYRDKNKDLTSPKACKVCNCHPLGSVTNTCDRATGKCVCKEGVDGDKCDRCKSGYEQTNVAMMPCRKIGQVWQPPPAQPPKQPQPPPRIVPDEGHPGDPDAVPPVVTPPREKTTGKGGLQTEKGGGGGGGRGPGGDGGDDDDDADDTCPGKCRSDDKRLSQIDYCMRGWALVVQVAKPPRRQRRWVQVTANIQQVYRCPQGCRDLPPSITLWVKRRNWKCGCPKVRARTKYLVLTRVKRHRRHKTDLVIDRQSVIWKWQRELDAKIQEYSRFNGNSADGCDCDCLLKRHRRQRKRERQNRKKQKQRQRQRQRRQRSSSWPRKA